MVRKVFYSFHYIPDSWRVQQIRNIGTIEDNKPCSSNEWEDVKKGGDAAIEKWITDQLNGRSCVIVLIGKETAGRKWITYEIIKGWDEKKGILGIYIHKLLDRDQKLTTKGDNPFDHVKLIGDGKPLSRFIKTYDPPYVTNTKVYGYIAENLDSWIDDAIKVRSEFVVPKSGSTP
jgi:hypothetical protein